MPRAPMPDSVSSLGAPVALPFCSGDFKVIISRRLGTSQNINLSEAAAHVALLNWILRAPTRHAHRILSAIDSKVVLGAMVKGRSSSPDLNRYCRKAASLLLAGGVQQWLLYVHTATNPADPPSRGRMRVKKVALKRGTQRPTKIQRQLKDLLRCAAVLH